MYLAAVVVLLAIAPVVSIFGEAALSHDPVSLLLLVGKWFTFWAVGLRLLIAGVRQVVRPEFTAREIFKSTDSAAYPIVREVGFGNLSMGTLGLATLVQPTWLLAAALVGGLYYGFAGVLHVFGKSRNLNENVAMISDLAMTAILLGFFGCEILRQTMPS